MKKFISILSSLLLLSSNALANNSNPWPIYPNYFNNPASARTLLGAAASDGSTPFMAGNGAINASSDNLRWSRVINVVDDFGADPTGTVDSSANISAALSVPALSAVIPGGSGGTGYAVGEILTPSSVGLVCSVTPTFIITSLGASNSVATVALHSSINLCANTTAVPVTPSTVSHPYFQTTVNGGGSGAQLNISWAPRNARILFPCGKFLLNSSVGAIHDYTDIEGNSSCTTIVTSSTIANNPNNGGLFASGVNGNAFANADFSQGNKHIRIHNLTFDLSSGASNAFAAFMVQSTDVTVDHVRFIGGTGGSGPMFVGSTDIHVDHNTLENFIVQMGIWGGSSNFWVDHNNFIGNGVARGAMQINGLGSNAAGFIPLSQTDSFGYIEHNVMRNFTGNGIDIQGLCQPAQNVCGFMQNITAAFNDIDTIGFIGIAYGNGDNVSILHNTINNIAHACISVASPLAGTVTSNTVIRGNICKNINTSNTSNTNAIQVGNTNDIHKNTIVDDNTVLGGGYNFAVQVTIGNPQHSAIQSAVVASGGSGTPAIGDTLFLAGGTPLANIGPTYTAGTFSTGTTYIISAVGTTDFTAIGASANTIGTSFTATGPGSGTGTAYFNGSTFTVTGVSGSAVTTVAPLFLGSYSVVPSNPVSTTSSGTGTGVTLTVSWTLLGPTNTLFNPGVEDAGTGGTDNVLGTLTSHVVYGAYTFPTEAIFSDSSLGLSIQQAVNTKYAQLSLVPANAHTFQFGVAGGSESSLGVAGCNFLYDAPALTVRYRLCADGNLNINPINGTAAVAKLDVNGSIRSAPLAIASLPTCNAAQSGTTQFVNNGIASPTFHQTVSTTGAATWAVHCTYDGSAYNWTY